MNENTERASRVPSAASGVSWTCGTCGDAPAPGEIRFERGYHWHTKCHVPNSFPSDGQLIPPTIMTRELPEAARVIVRRG